MKLNYYEFGNYEMHIERNASNEAIFYPVNFIWGRLQYDHPVMGKFLSLVINNKHLNP